MSEQFVSLVIFAIAMTCSPGSNNVLMASSGVQVGMRRSIPLGLGVVTGIVLLLTVSAIGLASIVHAEPSIRIVLKLVGSVYLIWLGWKIAHAGVPDFSIPDGGRGRGRGHRRGFMTGFINSLLNLKGWTMALSAAAGYTALAPTALQLAVILSLVFALIGVPNWALWCGGGQALARTLRTDRHWQLVNIALGSLVVVSLVPMWLE